MKRWRKNLTLSAMPRRGEKILALVHNVLVRGIVTDTRHGRVYFKWHGHGQVRRNREHVEWVRESDVEAAEAFKAAAALRR